jgi:TRAP-type C4-dicarboxylate transport system permease small subunit
MKIIQVFSRIANRIIETSVFAMLIAMVGIVSASVFWRYVLNDALSWSEELVRYLLVWVSFLGASIATYRGAHIGIAVVTDRLTERNQRVIGLLANLFILVFLGVILYQGIKILPVMAVRIAPTLGIRMKVFYMALPIAAGVMILHVVAQSMATLFHRTESR